MPVPATHPNGASAPAQGKSGSRVATSAQPLAERVVGSLVKDANSVWRLPGHGKFDYTDGESHEQYLRDAFRKATDLSSNSYELEGYIRDWVTEYHLSRKRSQLLRGFTFDGSDRVLEVGCGCGAITRFLGETFDDVVAIEGSLPRATLARMRTRDMPNVSILSAPFQDIKFATRFDIIFCVGVFEYSKIYVGGDNPHDAVLRHFSEILAPGGAVVLAIENQFGLKYFASSAEDHNNIMFDGLEGYPRHDLHRTFGYKDLKDRLTRLLGGARFYFPYPDYKLTSCVLSEDAFGRFNAAEMIGNFAPRDYSKARTPVFDQRLVLMELAKNDMLHLFANSFLAVAGENGAAKVGFDGLGILFSDRRRREFETETRIVQRGDGSVWVRKRRTGQGQAGAGDMSLDGYEERWIESESIQMQVLKKAKRRNIAFSDLFEACQAWMRKIRSVGVMKHGKMMVDGRYVDSTWANSFIDRGECVFIDNEWAWKGEIRASVLFLRSAYYLLNELKGMRDLNSQLMKGTVKSRIRRIGQELGIETDEDDWKEFLRLESEFTGAVATSRGSRLRRLKKKMGRVLHRLWASSGRVY